MTHIWFLSHLNDSFILIELALRRSLPFFKRRNKESYSPVSSVYSYLDCNVSVTAQTCMKPLLWSQATTDSLVIVVLCKAHLSPQPHMASDDNVQTTQSLMGFSGCFRGSRPRKTREAEGGKYIKWVREHIMGKTKRRVGWGGMETEGRCLWPTLVTVTTMLKFLIIVASLSWQWSEDMEMMPEETAYSTVSLPTMAYALLATIQHTGIHKHVHIGNHRHK